jgi:hypothetical protein
MRQDEPSCENTKIVVRTVVVRQPYMSQLKRVAPRENRMIRSQKTGKCVSKLL